MPHQPGSGHSQDSCVARGPDELTFSQGTLDRSEDARGHGMAVVSPWKDCPGEKRWACSPGPQMAKTRAGEWSYRDPEAGASQRY